MKTGATQQASTQNVLMEHLQLYGFQTEKLSFTTHNATTIVVDIFHNRHYSVDRINASLPVAIFPSVPVCGRLVKLQHQCYQRTQLPSDVISQMQNTYKYKHPTNGYTVQVCRDAQSCLLLTNSFAYFRSRIHVRGLKPTKDAEKHLIMSRFWQASSSEESSSDSELDETPQVATASAFRVAAARDLAFEESQRTAKSKDEKFREFISDSAKGLRSDVQSSNWASADETFKSLTKHLEKGAKRVEKNGIPSIFLKAMTELVDGIEDAWSQGSKEAGLKKLRTKLRKFLREKFKGIPLEESINQYRENPYSDAEEEEDDDDEHNGNEQEINDASKPVSTTRTRSKPSEKSLDSDDEFWGSDESDDDGLVDQAGRGKAQRNEQLGFRGWVASDFLKVKTPGPSKSEPVDDTTTQPSDAYQPQPAKVSKRKGDSEDEEDEEDEEEDERKGEEEEIPEQKIQLKPLFKKGEKITNDKVKNKLSELIAERGRNKHRIAEYRAQLYALKKICEENDISIGLIAETLVAIITSYFDEDLAATDFMDMIKWAMAHDHLHELFDILFENPNIVVDTEVTNDLEVGEDQAEFKLETDKHVLKTDVTRFVKRLDDEYLRSLRNIDPHSPDYVDRLSDDFVLYNLICVAEKYSERLTNSELCRMRLLRLEHIYYKRDFVNITPRGATKLLTSKVVKLLEKGEDPPPEDIQGQTPARWVIDNEAEKDILGLVRQLSTFLCRNGNARIATRAVLCHIYSLSIFDKWDDARDLMLMTYLQDTISKADISTQILYNRTMAQLGLCAFRSGNINQAQSALNEIVGRAKELLAQGYKFHSGKSQSQITQEKIRQTPFHMHINLGLLDAVYFTCSMLMEVPIIAQTGISRTRTMNRLFRHRLEEFCSDLYQAPAEATREKIMSASLAMLQGDWKLCSSIICKLGVWERMHNGGEVMEMLTQNIQRETLRTYLLFNAGYYDTITLDRL
eukprot:gene4450-6699_t